MYAEELTTLIRQRTAYRGASLNDSGAWRAAINAACGVIDEVMEHAPKVVEQPVVAPVKKFGKKKDEDGTKDE
jgi:hypothetical protein